MGIFIQISSSGAPIYAQIVAQVESAVARGELKPGDKIPPVRKLAEELVVNPNTVAKSYRQMEQMGLVETRKGAGTFVLDPKSRAVESRDLDRLAEQIDTVIGRGMSLGMSERELRELFEQRLSTFTKKGGAA
jgi:GntR family transcriptional regulator